MILEEHKNQYNSTNCPSWSHPMGLTTYHCLTPIVIDVRRWNSLAIDGDIAHHSVLWVDQQYKNKQT